MPKQCVLVTWYGDSEWAIYQTFEPSLDALSLRSDVQDQPDHVPRPPTGVWGQLGPGLLSRTTLVLPAGRLKRVGNAHDAFLSTAQVQRARFCRCAADT